MGMLIKEKFKNPQDVFSPYCFFFVNDDFEKEHMVEMAQEMEKKGMSIGYIQDRGARNNKFLSPGFYDTLKAIIQNTKLPLGLCDEVGGMYGCSSLVEDMPRGVSLYWEKAENIVQDCFFAVGFSEENNKIETDTLTLLAPGDLLADGQKAFAFHKYHGRSRSGSDIDYLDPKTADIILREVYEDVKANLGEYFGNRFAGFFMDLEGDYGNKLAYSEALERKYYELYQEELLPVIPLLFMEDTKGMWIKVRYQYHAAITETYNVFFEKIALWCQKNNVIFTGHLWEENLFGQVLQTGDFYRIMKNFSMIGVDSLRLECYEPRDFKEAQTIADKEKKPYMCELIGCAGWGLSPAEIKRAVNCITTWGVNHIILHGIHSDRTVKKMGFAPDMYNDNPYWNYFDQISDYMKRTSYINTLGNMYVDTVLFHPIDSVKALVGDYFFEKDKELKGYIIEQRDMLQCKNGLLIKNVEDSYSKVISELTNKRIQFYIYDEEYFATESFEGIENIVIPSVFLMSEKLINKLAMLSEQGKKIYFVGNTPYATVESGMDCKRVNELLSHIKGIRTSLDIDSKIIIKNGEFCLKASHRKEGRTHYFWLYNDTNQKHDAVIELKGVGGTAELMNCETGDMSAIYSIDTAEGTELYLHFDEYEGVWIKITAAQDITLDPFEIENAQALLSTPDFTGSITLKTSFTVEDFDKVILTAEEVYHMAEVFVNGESVGARLWKPFQWDLTEHVRTGVNTVEIVVGNLICSSLKDYGDKWQVGIHRKNPPTAYLSGIDGKVRLKVY